MEPENAPLLQESQSHLETEDDTLDMVQARQSRRESMHLPVIGLALLQHVNVHQLRLNVGFLIRFIW